MVEPRYRPQRVCRRVMVFFYENGVWRTECFKVNISQQNSFMGFGVRDVVLLVGMDFGMKFDCKKMIRLKTEPTIVRI